jgi:hypothetical protein
VTKFEDLIQLGIQKSGRTQGDPSGPFQIGFTAGELETAIKAVKTPSEAKAFYVGYVKYLKDLPAEEQKFRKIKRTPEQAAISNIWWMFGMGPMPPEKIIMWNNALKQFRSKDGGGSGK